MNTATSHQTDARRAAAALALAALLAIAGFTALGSVFAYPQILEEPTADILELFRAHQGAVMSWFGVLVVSAALMAPAGIWLGRLVGGSLGRWIAGVGIAAAAVQVVGLQRGSRWYPASARTRSILHGVPRLRVASSCGTRCSARPSARLWDTP